MVLSYAHEIYHKSFHVHTEEILSDRFLVHNELRALYNDFMLFTFELHDIYLLFRLILKLRTVGLGSHIRILLMERRSRCAKYCTPWPTVGCGFLKLQWLLWMAQYLTEMNCQSELVFTVRC